ncbi:gamma-glutamyltransferase [Polycladidibacter hongkongensis]|uniref:gamma-glutamyltransferase n=1 Tax=Polycladidibacter hongkongensis TaxID=1647556 RepID=UPI000B26E6BA|nr:gamma-glutamyltransferase [Pseudovibrio hongkongensis]
MSSRDFQMNGRSAVYGQRAMVATSHPLASEAAVGILHKGGNAADAAVAAVAVQGVVEPQMTGIGGDCFALVGQEGRKLWGMNASGRSAAAANAAALREEGLSKVPPHSGHAVTVPGAVRGWEMLLQEFGRLSWAEVLAPAIGYARNGFPVAPRVAFDWQGLVPALRVCEASEKIYLRAGAAPKAGDVMRFAQLAETLERIAAEGADGFYKGPVAQDIAAQVQAHGGLLTVDDLAAMQAEEVVPITSDYAGLEIAELPPNGQGIVALLLLEILKRFDLRGLEPLGVQRLHIHMEATKLAYSARDAFLADPQAMAFDAMELLRADHVDKLAGRIRMDGVLPRQQTQLLSPKSDTVCLSVVDEDGLAVSLINSIYKGFGSCITAPQSGVLLQNRGACFSLEEGHANELLGGKRPMHTIIPAIAMQDGRPSIAFGVMGGGYQPCGHAYVLSNMLDYQMDIQAAIDLPRVFIDEDSLALQAEAGIPEESCAGLRAIGHRLERVREPIGGGQGIVIDRNRGVLIGGSDPRKDGCAIGF